MRYGQHFSYIVADVVPYHGRDELSIFISRRYRHDRREGYDTYLSFTKLTAGLPQPFQRDNCTFEFSSLRLDRHDVMYNITGS